MKLSRLRRPTGPKRPWLAGLLALLVTGLGHAYLRRWLRGLGWLAATFAAVALLVPPEVVEALNAGEPLSNPADALPPVVVVVASAVDAYLLARRTRSRAAAPAGATGPGPADGPTASATAGAAAADPAHGAEARACPECGKDLDADLDFCPWCTAELDRPGPNGGGGRNAGR
ncbi:DUF7575 domain-containing protein [Halobaculum sp. EA56]|uniref:DUF7575 domain-containing protein n=1 Tax=Halobaculum sp. EA56 TaxID=3421648 RepID=UPI003EBBF139